MSQQFKSSSYQYDKDDKSYCDNLQMFICLLYLASRAVEVQKIRLSFFQDKTFYELPTVTLILLRQQQLTLKVYSTCVLVVNLKPLKQALRLHFTNITTDTVVYKVFQAFLYFPFLVTHFFYKNPLNKNHEVQISEILRIFKGSIT